MDYTCLHSLSSFFHSVSVLRPDQVLDRIAQGISQNQARHEHETVQLVSCDEPKLNAVEWGGWPVAPECVTALSRALPRNHHVWRVCLTNTKLTPDAALDLVLALEANSSVRCVDLGSRGGGLQGALGLELVTRMERACARNAIRWVHEPVPIEHALQGITYTEEAATVDFSCASLGDGEVAALGEALAQGQGRAKVQGVCLDGSSVTPVGLLSLAGTLPGSGVQWVSFRQGSGGVEDSPEAEAAEAELHAAVARNRGAHFARPGLSGPGETAAVAQHARASFLLEGLRVVADRLLARVCPATATRLAFVTMREACQRELKPLASGIPEAPCREEPLQHAGGRGSLLDGGIDATSPLSAAKKKQHGLIHGLGMRRRQLGGGGLPDFSPDALIASSPLGGAGSSPGPSPFGKRKHRRGGVSPAGGGGALAAAFGGSSNLSLLRPGSRDSGALKSERRRGRLRSSRQQWHHRRSVTSP